MDQALIQADRLSKVYRLYASPWDRLRESLVRRPCHRAVHALDDVSFSLERGESLGIVGENGAGKSTLLKLLSGVLAPTSGQLRVRGRVASLLELGMGFHSELSGRQNIRLTAAIMGFSAREVAERIPSIIDFSELGDFIDRPIKTYSSGMAMRLGFSIAAQVDPEILIIDEALSVGDGYFQKKCMDKIRALLDGGCTFLFCSHAMYYVNTFCDRALWLRQGRAEALGPVAGVIREYDSYLLARRRRSGTMDEDASKAVEAMTSGADALESHAAAGAIGSDATQPGVDAPERPARLTDVRLADGEANGTFRFGGSWGLDVSWQSARRHLAFQLGIGINRSDGVQVCSFLSHRDGVQPITGRNDYRVHLCVPKLPIFRGNFDLYVFLADEVGLHVYDQLHLPNAFVVDSDDYDYGLVQVDHRWDLAGAEVVGEPCALVDVAAG